MNRLEQQLSGKKSSLFFITAGDPDLETSLEIMKALADGGASCIELGMPFSDPIADGPVIQRSTARALKKLVTIDDILQLVQTFRQTHDTPIVLMGYLNPVMFYGEQPFVLACEKAGVDGLIIADLPWEEGEKMETICKEHGIALIYLLAPELSSDRTKAIARASTGFIYCVAQYSPTGTKEETRQTLAPIVESIKSDTDLPVLVGFGISSVERVGEVSKIADGIIIGSWLIQELEKSENKAERAAQFVKAVNETILNL